MKITCVADIHGYLPQLPGGDLLIIAGDLTARDREGEYFDVFDWIDEAPYKMKILVCGNHDARIQREGYTGPTNQEFVYLEDSMTTFQGLKIWGTPRTPWFWGVNPACKAFMGSENDLAGFYSEIPQGIDILISHGPALGYLDKCDKGRVGSYALRQAVERVQPRLLITGHIHTEGGNRMLMKHAGKDTLCINASHCNDRYEPVHPPVNIEFENNYVV